MSYSSTLDILVAVKNHVRKDMVRLFAVRRSVRNAIDSQLVVRDDYKPILEKLWRTEDEIRRLYHDYRWRQREIKKFGKKA